MSATAAILLEIDPLIRSRRDLLNYVQAASDFLESQLAEGPPTRTSSTVKIEWTINQLNGEEFVKPKVSELEEDGSLRSSMRAIPTRHLSDTVNREIWMLRLWGDILSARSAENMKRINGLLRELDEEEQADGDQIAD